MSWKGCWAPNLTIFFDDPCDLRMRVSWVMWPPRLLDLFVPRAAQTTLRQGYPALPSHPRLGEIGQSWAHDVDGKKVQDCWRGKGQKQVFMLRPAKWNLGIKLGGGLQTILSLWKWVEMEREIWLVVEKGGEREWVWPRPETHTLLSCCLFPPFTRQTLSSTTMSTSFTFHYLHRFLQCRSHQFNNLH